MRRTTVLGAATAAALAAGSLAVTGVLGSSHREAPKILADPTADNTDVYAFTAPDAPKSLTVVANWIPMEEPAGGPYFGKLDPRARYYVKIDNTGDGREDVAYRWKFKQRFRNPESFLDAAPTVDSVDDPDINFVQTYDLYKETYGKGRQPLDAADRPRRAGRAGQHRAEDGPGLRQGGRGRDPRAPGRRQDVRRAGRRPVLRRPQHRLRRAEHRQAGASEHRPGQPGRRQGRRRGLQHARVRAAGARVRGHARRQVRRGREGRQRRRRRVGDAPSAGACSVRREQGTTAARWVQVSRLGNPLINEVVIPIGQKDKFNRTSPANDAKNFGKYALNPELARLLNALFKLGVKETNRTDIVQALLTGVPGLTQIGDKPAAADTLKLNLGVPPSAQPEPLRRPRGRPRRLPERPPAHRRRDGHRAARDRRAPCSRRPGRQADPARRRRRPERQAVPVERSRTSRCPATGSPACRRSGSSRRTPRSRSRRPEPRIVGAAAQDAPAHPPPLCTP